jgi:hypothetical protein
MTELPHLWTRAWISLHYGEPTLVLSTRIDGGKISYEEEKNVAMANRHG